MNRYLQFSDDNHAFPPPHLGRGSVGIPTHWLSSLWMWRSSPHTWGKYSINSLAPGWCSYNLKLIISNLMSTLYIWEFPKKLLSGECHKTSHWWLVKISSGNELRRPFRWTPTLVEVMAWCHRHQVITWTNVDWCLWWHMASLSH